MSSEKLNMFTLGYWTGTGTRGKGSSSTFFLQVCEAIKVLFSLPLFDSNLLNFTQVANGSQPVTDWWRWWGLLLSADEGQGTHCQDGATAC